MLTRRLRTIGAVGAAVLMASTAAVVTMSQASAAVINTGAWYQVVNRHSGKALEVTGGSTADQAMITQNTRGTAASQQFQFVDSGGGYYRLRARHSGKVVDLWQWNVADGAEFRQWPDLNGANQQFRVLDSDSGYVRLINRHSNKALEVWQWSTANGGRVSQFSDLNGANQQWQLVVAGTNPTTVPTTRTTTRTTGPTRPVTPPTTRATSSPSGNTPVARHGQLRVCGTRMCDRSGAAVQLRGVSSMWLNWESRGYAENLSALTWMRDNWNLTVIRAAMGVEPAGAYLSDPARARGQVERIINNAVAAGVYVIVDWHAHDAQNHTSQAAAFFGDLARRYGHLPNVIWETFNEPLQVSWTGVLKPYHQTVLASIRAADPDNIVVLGTPQWSQAVDQAALSPVSGTNLMYTLHFYSCSHGQWLRDRGNTAMRAGLALFVTEWGASHADGGTDGRVCAPEAQAWLDWMRSNGISWTAWKLSTGTDSTNLLANGAPVTGGWNNYLHGHAPFVVQNMR